MQRIDTVTYSMVGVIRESEKDAGNAMDDKFRADYLRAAIVQGVCCVVSFVVLCLSVYNRSVWSIPCSGLFAGFGVHAYRYYGFYKGKKE